MKIGLYSRIALGNVRKNYRFFIPRILAEAGLLGCFYIALTLSLDERITEARGGGYIPFFMGFGTIILGLLSLVLMLYTNSFLMKQRRREFGLYNVLGMEKRHVGKVLFFETLLCSVASLLLGLLLGILFYKLSALLICRLLQTEFVLGTYFIAAKTIVPSLLVFGLLDVFIYVINRISLAKMKPVELLQSKNEGEREPKTKWIMLLLGLLSLGGGYWISLATSDALNGFINFFVAVTLVIVGTYFLFVSGSIFVLKALKRNKNYYYTGKHFVSVSGLLYRMKQNAVGLASICILATGVLVMISTTVSLYSGMQQALDEQYPQDLYVTATVYYEDGTSEPVQTKYLLEAVEDSAKKNGLTVKDSFSQCFLQVAYQNKNGTLLTKSAARDNVPLSEIAGFVFITEDTYRALTGETLGLEADEIAVCRITNEFGNSTVYDAYTVGQKTYSVKTVLSNFPVATSLRISTQVFGIVVKDDAAFSYIYQDQLRGYGDYASPYSCRLAVTFEDYDGDTTAFQNDLFTYVYKICEREYTGGVGREMRVDSVWGEQEEILSMYGTFLFLGIILGIVCLFATALIIFYKQISEGYEDRDRFQIMKKVGMSDGEIHKSIRTQIIIVFFLPLLVAGVHLCFAFPLLLKLLSLLMLPSMWIFLNCSVVAYAVFALVYVLIYSATAKTYYKIVQ